MSRAAATVTIRLLIRRPPNGCTTMARPSSATRSVSQPRKGSSSRKPDARGGSRSPPARFRFRGIHRHCRNEAIPVWHFDLGQGLGVHYVGLLDDAVPIEQKCDHRVNFVVGERSRFRDGHRAVDIVPCDRRVRVVGYTVLFLRFERAEIRLAGAAQRQTPEYPPFPILPVAYLAPLRKDHGAFLGGSAARRKFLSLWADHEVKAPDFFLAQRRAHIKFGRLRQPHRGGRQDHHGREQIKRTSHCVRSHRWPPSTAAWHWYEWSGRVFSI